MFVAREAQCHLVYSAVVSCNLEMSGGGRVTMFWILYTKGHLNASHFDWHELIEDRGIRMVRLRRLCFSVRVMLLFLRMDERIN